jgi:hypothetical protein
VIILQIQVQNLILFDLKGNPPVSADRDAPCSGSVPGELMNTPAQNFTYSIDQIGPKAPVIVILDETPEPSMSHAADMHTDNRTSLPYSRQALLLFGLSGAIAQRLAANSLQALKS